LNTKFLNDYVVYSSKRMTDLKLFSVFNSFKPGLHHLTPRGRAKVDEVISGTIFLGTPSFE
jgi:hypothetical protein